MKFRMNKVHVIFISQSNSGTNNKIILSEPILEPSVKLSYKHLHTMFNGSIVNLLI